MLSPISLSEIPCRNIILTVGWSFVSEEAIKSQNLTEYIQENQQSTFHRERLWNRADHIENHTFACCALKEQTV